MQGEYAGSTRNYVEESLALFRAVRVVRQALPFSLYWVWQVMLMFGLKATLTLAQAHARAGGEASRCYRDVGTKSA